MLCGWSLTVSSLNISDVMVTGPGIVHMHGTVHYDHLWEVMSDLHLHRDPEET